MNVFFHLASAIMLCFGVWQLLRLQRHNRDLRQWLYQAVTGKQERLIASTVPETLARIATLVNTKLIFTNSHKEETKLRRVDQLALIRLCWSCDLQEIQATWTDEGALQLVLFVSHPTADQEPGPSEGQGNLELLASRGLGGATTVKFGKQ